MNLTQISNVITKLSKETSKISKTNSKKTGTKKNIAKKVASKKSARGKNALSKLNLSKIGKSLIKNFDVKNVIDIAKNSDEIKNLLAKVGLNIQNDKSSKIINESISKVKSFIKKKFGNVEDETINNILSNVLNSTVVKSHIEKVVGKGSVSKIKTAIKQFLT